MLISIDNLSIEVTRRCNLHCEHCLRGNAQPLDIDLKYVKTLFKKISYINCLTLTGGEPSLKPNIIRDIVKIAKKYNVEIGSFYIATNGKKISNDFLLAIIELHNYCSDNEVSSVQVSNDSYHYDCFEYDKLNVFSFVSNKGEISYPIAEGRAKDFGKRKVLSDTIIINNGYKTLQDANIYLNCKGNLISGCNFSYKSQNKPENIICHVNKFSWDTVKEFYNVEIED